MNKVWGGLGLVLALALSTRLLGVAVGAVTDLGDLKDLQQPGLVLVAAVGMMLTGAGMTLVSVGYEPARVTGRRWQ